MTKLEEIFDHTTENIKPEVGRLLVAEPFLKGEYFERSVIAMVTVDSKDGDMGIVLGNRTDTTLGEIIDDLEVGHDIPVYLGGPVGADRLFYIQTLGTAFEPNALSLGNGLWLGSDPMSAIKATAYGIFPEGSFRFYVGYSGWDKGQLEGEIADDTWALTDKGLGADILRLEGDRMWDYAVTSLGARYRHWRLHPRVLYSN